MKLSIDNQQKITITLIFLLEMYKIFMGSLLIIFVPQMCFTKPCSMIDNITMSTPFEMVGIIMNILTLLSIINLYYSELKREHYAIEYLDIDSSKPNNYLDQEIENYKEIKYKISQVNKLYLRNFKISFLINLLNIILSTIVIYNNYLGISTITAYTSYLILLFTKYYNIYFISTKSIKEERIYSGYMKTLVTYNTIDIDHKNNKI